MSFDCQRNPPTALAFLTVCPGHVRLWVLGGEEREDFMHSSPKCMPRILTVTKNNRNRDNGAVELEFARGVDLKCPPPSPPKKDNVVMDVLIN